MKNKKGISLIVLVITIIVMVVLSAAVVITLTNTGIIDRSDHAVNLTNEKQVQEMAAIFWADAYIDNIRGEELVAKVKDELKKQGITEEDWEIKISDTGVEVANKNLMGLRIEREYDDNGLVTKAVVTDGKVEYEIGTSVNYMPDGVGTNSYKGGWKLLGVDKEGRMLIVSSVGIPGSEVTLNGKDGYINGVAAMHEKVKGYNDGTIGISVRALDGNDVNAVIGYDPKTFRGEDYLTLLTRAYKEMGVEGTLEEIEATLMAAYGATAKDKFAIMNNGLSVNCFWDGSEYTKYSYIINGVTTAGSFTHLHKDTGFEYYDKQEKAFKMSGYTETNTNIGTVNNSFYAYYGDEKLASASKAYKMLFVKNDGSGTDTYWLASSFENALLTAVGYGVRNVDAGYLAGWNLTLSTGTTTTPTHIVRAVVTLAPGITLKDSATLAGTYDIVQ